ncbi:hypothetical protein FQR65_LT10418 [Abscondita terminalis]|nr:hypothetical protein FQR65_LT10418 [Abscondita terminalis]
MEEEEKEAMEKRHRAEVEKVLRSRIEVRESLIRQMQDHVEQKHLQAEEEAKFKQEMVAKLIEDERLDQLSNEKKRMKLIQLRKDVEKMLQDRRQLRAEQMQLQMRLIEDERKEEAERLRLIQEERIRMLQEHAAKLIGYLPKGVLGPDDLQYLDTTVAEAYAHTK